MRMKNVTAMNNIKLTKKVKKKWLEALRSGKYKQGKNELIKATNGGFSYCCLGVLQAITGLKVDNCGLLTNRRADITCVKGLSVDTQGELSTFNDTDKSFDWIADWIDKNITPLI